jgi:hypothetical protein
MLKELAKTGEVELFDFEGQQYVKWRHIVHFASKDARPDEHWDLIDFTTMTKLPWSPPPVLSRLPSRSSSPRARTAPPRRPRQGAALDAR